MELTKEQIEQMPAGVELNNLVAEHVLGFVWAHNKRYAFLRPANQVDDLVEANYASYGKHPEGNNIGPDDSYSTDIAAACEVVDNHPGAFALVKTEEGTYEAKAYAPGEDEFVPVTAGTAPLAICRAALLAIMLKGGPDANP